MRCEKREGTKELAERPALLVFEMPSPRDTAKSATLMPEPRILPVEYNALTEAGEEPMFMARFGLLAVGIGATMAMAVIALIACTAFFFQHHQSGRASAQTAEAEFERIRARFADQHPLLDMHERRPRSDVGGPQPGAPLRSFNTMIFDTRGGERLVRITVPYRFARLFGRDKGFRWLGQLTFLDDTEFDPEPIQLSLAQVERHGPGLMVDYRHPTGGQFIAWVE